MLPDRELILGKSQKNLTKSEIVLRRDILHENVL